MRRENNFSGTTLRPGDVIGYKEENGQGHTIILRPDKKAHLPLHFANGKKSYKHLAPLAYTEFKMQCELMATTIMVSIQAISTTVMDVRWAFKVC